MSTVFWKDLSTEQTGSETAQCCMRLLTQRLDNKITEEEFEKEIHYVTLLPDCLSDHAFKEPPAATIEVQTANQTLEKEKQSLRANEILDMGAFHKAHPCLMDYSEKVEAVTRTNQRNACTLEVDHAFFKQLGDTLSSMKIQEVYQTYPLSLWIGKVQIWRKKKL